MKYRANCTYCVSPIMNLYPMSKNHYYYSETDLYIEVNKLEEANLIEQLNHYQEGSFRVYNELSKLISNNH